MPSLSNFYTGNSKNYPKKKIHSYHAMVLNFSTADQAFVDMHVSTWTQHTTCVYKYVLCAWNACAAHAIGTIKLYDKNLLFIFPFGYNANLFYLSLFYCDYHKAFKSNIQWQNQVFRFVCVYDFYMVTRCCSYFVYKSHDQDYNKK